MLAKTDTTFNTNEKRLLLQCFISINNTSSTFQFLQAFATAKSADIIRFLLQILQDYFFYNCPGFAVLTSDFGAGLNTGFVQKATQNAKDTKVTATTAAIRKEKNVQQETSPNKLDLNDYPLLITSSQPAYKPDSQTIIVNNDLIRAIP
jgi:hypothetical protein